MKVLVVGAFKYHMYQEALCYGLEQNDIEVVRLKITDVRPYGLLTTFKNGKLIWDYVIKHEPDVLFLYRVENIFSYIIKKIKKMYPHVWVAQYHNDDPFRKGFKRYIKSYHYLQYMKYTDMTYVYRRVNIEEAIKRGAKHAKLFMSHYDSRTDLKKITRLDCGNKNGKIVFLGHWENDDRKEYINTCFKLGFNLHIYGPDDWRKIFISNGWPIQNLHPTIYGEEYCKVIHEASIALAFFSTANRDEYTRRCFEIPVSGTAILQKRTAITNKIFKDGIDALLFSDVDEFTNKIKFYLSRPDDLNTIAYNGYQLMLNGEFSEKSRAKQIIDDYINLAK